MGHGFCQWNEGLCIAFAACLIICLGPGAEAIICRKCSSKIEGKCRLRKKTCEDTRDNAVCMVGKKYTDDRLIGTFMTCAVDSLSCGAELEIPVDRFRMDINCCSDRDFCSDDM